MPTGRVYVISRRAAPCHSHLGLSGRAFSANGGGVRNEGLACLFDDQPLVALLPDAQERCLSLRPEERVRVVHALTVNRETALGSQPPGFTLGGAKAGANEDIGDAQAGLHICG